MKTSHPRCADQRSGPARRPAERQALMPTADKKPGSTAAAAGLREIEVCSFVPAEAAAADGRRRRRGAPRADASRADGDGPGAEPARREAALAAGVHKLTIPVSRVPRTRWPTCARRARRWSKRCATSSRCATRRRPACTSRPACPRRSAARCRARCPRTTWSGWPGRSQPAPTKPACPTPPAWPTRRRSGACSSGSALPSATDWRCAHAQHPRAGPGQCLAAWEVGVRTFDASLGGLGGCPYAPGASGNVVTEDLVFMFEAMGVRTGVDIAKLIAARAPLQGRTSGRAGLRDDSRSRRAQGLGGSRACSLKGSSHQAAASDPRRERRREGAVMDSRSTGWAGGPHQNWHQHSSRVSRFTRLAGATRRGLGSCRHGSFGSDPPPKFGARGGGTAPPGCGSSPSEDVLFVTPSSTDRVVHSMRVA